MTNLLQRIIMFVFFIPLIIVLILFLPQYQHIMLQCVTVLFAAGLAIEIARLYGLWPLGMPDEKKPKLRFRLIRILGVLACGLVPPLTRMAVSFSLLPSELIAFSFVLPILWIFASQVIMSQIVPIEEFLKRTHGYLMIVVYPALGLSFFLAIIALKDSWLLLLIFLGAVFMNDTFAYIGGRFLGRRSNHPMKISPNKTLIGFVCGFLASLAVMFVGYVYDPSLFPGGPLAVGLIGILIGAATIIGDLFESGLKRSFGTKDSGTVILGRGGMLDSVDSLVFAAPLFYFSYILLNHFSL